MAGPPSVTLSRRAHGLVRRPDVVVAIVVAVTGGVLLWVWIWRQPFVGLADNGDWGRYLCPVRLSPHPFGLYFDSVPTHLVGAPYCGFFYRSSQFVVLWGARLLNRALGGELLSLRSLSVMLGVPALVAWGIFAQQLTLATKRPYVALGAALGGVLAFADVTFSSYLGSAYVEALVFAATPVLLAALVRVVRGPARWWTWLLGVLAVLGITTAKPHMAPLALIVVVVVALALRTTGWSFRVWVGAAVLVALGLAVFDLTVFTEGTIDDANHTNLVFTGLLLDVEDPAATLAGFGLSEAAVADLSQYVGSSYWGGEGSLPTAAYFDDFMASVSRNEVLGYVMSRPSIQWKMLRRAVTAIPHARVDKLANFAQPGDQPLADRPEPVRALAVRLVDASWLLLLAAWLMLIGVGIWRMWQVPRRPVAAIVAVLAALALSTTVLSVGDGYVDIERHAVVGAWFNGLLMLGGLGAAVGRGVESAMRRVRPRPGS